MGGREGLIDTAVKTSSTGGWGCRGQGTVTPLAPPAVVRDAVGCAEPMQLMSDQAATMPSAQYHCHPFTALSVLPVLQATSSAAWSRPWRTSSFATMAQSARRWAPLCRWVLSFVAACHHRIVAVPQPLTCPDVSMAMPGGDPSPHCPPFMQFLYGEDGMDGTRVEGQALDHLKLDVSELGHWLGSWAVCCMPVWRLPTRLAGGPGLGPPPAGREWVACVWRLGGSG